MKIFTFLFVLIFIFPSFIKAQEETEKLSVKFNGYVDYSFFLDTYESATTRDGLVYLYPLSENLDANGDDLNKNIQAQMIDVESRTRLTASGLSAFGAQSKVIIEGDFLGTAEAYTRLFRLRHAYIQLNWEHSELLTGKTWHPMFVTGCFPGVFSFGAAAPFNPLSRAPQVRYTFMPTSNLDFMGALLFHGDFKSLGPADAQQNSGIPDMQFQFRFHNDVVYTGFTVGYKVLQPRSEVISTNTKTNEKIGSYNFQAFAKLTLKPVIVKAQAIYGQNLSNFVMLGGYGASEDPVLNPDYSYTNLNSISLWSEVNTSFKKLNGAVFIGYSKNMGANEDYYTLGYARGENIDYILRVSPRIQYTSGKMTIILEHMFSSAVYGTAFNSKHKATSTADATINNRIIVGAKYTF